MSPASFVCCGVRIDAHTTTTAAAELGRLAQEGQGAVAHLCNAYVLALASKDDEYAVLLNRGDLNLPDGTPVAWIGGLRGASGLDGPTPGTEVFERTLSDGIPHGLRHFLYGSSEEVVRRLQEVLASRHPAASIVGAESPPFRPLTGAEEDGLVARLRAAAPHVVWVALGTPKQDVVADRLAQRVGAVFVPIGAAFDFVAGTKRRAPRWMRRLSLEWAHRLATEPRRLWWRYLWGNVVFLAVVWREGRARNQVDR